MCVCVADAYLGAEEFQGRQGEWEKIMKGENNENLLYTCLKLIFPFYRYGKRGLVVMKTDLRIQPRFTHFKDSLLLSSWNHKICILQKAPVHVRYWIVAFFPNPFLFL